MTTATAPKLDRAKRLDLARSLIPLPRKPIPMLLLLIKLYVDSGDGSGYLAFGQGVAAIDAIDVLRARLDDAAPQDFAEVVRVWASEHGCRWVG